MKAVVIAVLAVALAAACVLSIRAYNARKLQSSAPSIGGAAERQQGLSAANPIAEPADMPLPPKPPDTYTAGGAPFAPIGQANRRRRARQNATTAAAPKQAPPGPVSAVAAPPVPKLAVPEEMAREALSYVGFDPAAEALWIQAINDPNLGNNARQNLIEDLNEDGFPDPQNVTPEDLPLIVNRLELLQSLALDPMDAVNAAAIQEAFKDLMDMFEGLTRQ